MTPRELFDSGHPLKEQLAGRLPWLFQELGFRIVDHGYSHKAMGSSMVELESDTLRVRFNNDRGGISVDVASLAEPEHWMELGFLWKALKDVRPNPALEGWAWFIREHLAELVDALGPGFHDTKRAWDRQLEEGWLAAAPYIRPRGILERVFLPQAVWWVRRVVAWCGVIVLAWIVWILFRVK
jgi:hypothetical protein